MGTGSRLSVPLPRIVCYTELFQQYPSLHRQYVRTLKTTLAIYWEHEDTLQNDSSLAQTKNVNGMNALQLPYPFTICIFAWELSFRLPLGPRPLLRYIRRTTSPELCQKFYPVSSGGPAKDWLDPEIGATVRPASEVVLRHTSSKLRPLTCFS